MVTVYTHITCIYIDIWILCVEFGRRKFPVVPRDMENTGGPRQPGHGIFTLPRGRQAMCRGSRQDYGEHLVAIRRG